MLTLAFISQMMVAAFGRSWLETGTMRARFKGAAYLGDEVETCGRVTKEEPISSGRLVACSVGLRNRRSGQELISASATVQTNLKEFKMLREAAPWNRPGAVA